MEQKFHRKLSWPPASAKAKHVHRHHISDLLKLCRKKSQALDHSSYRSSLRECVRLLLEFLDCPQNTCGCRESSMQHSCSPDAFLRPVFQYYRQHEELSGSCGGSGSPFQLLSELFLQLESTCCWHRLVTEAPRLQELLPVSCHSPVGKSQKCRSHCTPGRRSQEHETAFPAERLYNPSQDRSKDLTEKDVLSEQRPRRGYLASVRELKNSLKMDLEQHQLYLLDIEFRLSGLERRAQDVTRLLERADLELKAIKQGSVVQRTLVGQQKSSPGSDDLEERDLQAHRCQGLSRTWSEDAMRSDRLWCEVTPSTQNKRGRTEDPAHRPADGGRSCWGDIQAGISLCQDQVNVLIRRVNLQITRTETNLNSTWT